MSRSSARVAFAAAAYVALTIALTWPLVLHPRSLVPHDLGDPLLTTWMVWWNATAVPLTETWWNAPQFFPFKGSFALSEHLLGLAPITTPLILLTGDPLLAHNVAFLLSFILCGMSAHYLVFTITRRHDLSLVGGIAFAFAPYRLLQIPHIQVLSSYWMPLSLAALHRYFEIPPSAHEPGRRWRWLVLFAGAWLMQALSSSYYVFFLSVLIALWVAWFVLFRGEWPRLLNVAIAWCAAAALFAPVALGYLRVANAYNFQRSITEIRLYSADVASLLKAYDHNRAWGWLQVIKRPECDLFPGLTVVLFSAVGLVLAWRRASATRARYPAAGRIALALGLTTAALTIVRLVHGPFRVDVAGVRLLSVNSPEKPISVAVLCFIVAAACHPRVRESWRRQSVLAFYALAAFAMWVLSLGPEPTLMDAPVLYKPPYSWFMMLPGADGIRVPARFWMLAALCLAVTAALGLGLIVQRWPRASRWLPALVVVGLLVDAWPRWLRMEPRPPERPNHTAADLRLDLPLSSAADTLALFRSITHRRPIINGYSGYFPPHYGSLNHMMSRKDPAAIATLAKLGSIEVMVDHSLDPDGEWRGLMTRTAGASVVYAGSDYTSYLVPRKVEENPADGRGVPVPFRIASATVNDALAPLIDDRNLATRWYVLRKQFGTQSISVELDPPSEVKRVELLLGGYGWDYPRQLLVETSLDGRTWSAAWEGETVGLVLSGALERPRQVPIAIPLRPSPTRFIRFTHSRTDDVHDWSIAELRVLK